MMRTIFKVFVLMIAAAGVAACSSGTESRGVADADDTGGARYLTLAERDGYTEAIVADPWNPGQTMGRYALVSDTAAVVPDSLTAVNVPLSRAVVMSMVHTAAFAELGRADAVAGVADVDYYPADDPMTERLASGLTVDVGSSMAPTAEKIIALAPDAMLVSPSEGVVPQSVAGAGIPVIMLPDYMETTPAARAEWIKFIGALVGCRAMADSIYTAVVAEYDSLRTLAASAADHPTVITERPYSGVWYVPGGASYKAAMLADAGADYVWVDDASTGSLSLNEEAVIARGAGARYWLLNELNDLTSPSMLVDAMPHCKAFAAFPSGVYYCNSVATPLYRDIAFHPERVLRDIIYIFHPELRDNAPLVYYKPLKQ